MQTSLLLVSLFALQVTVLGMGLCATATAWDQLRRFIDGGSDDSAISPCLHFVTLRPETHKGRV